MPSPRRPRLHTLCKAPAPGRGPALLLLCGSMACADWGAECGQGQESLDLHAGLGDFLYQDGVILDLDLGVEPTELATLPLDWREDQEDVHAWLDVLGEQHEAGLRLKGERSFRPIDKKASIKLDLHQWDHDASLYGVRRLTLNNMIQDPTMLAEHVGYRLYQALGLVAPRQGYACVSVDGEPRGLYSVVETMDEQFLDRAFEDDSGNLYEGGHGADLRPGRVTLFQLQDQGVPEDWADLEVLLAALENSSPDTLMDTLARHFDLDSLMLGMAASLYLGSIDSYITRANNFLLYHAPGNGKWTLIPWGLDQALLQALDPHDPYDPEALAEHGRIFEDCLASQACVAALDEALLQVADEAEAMGLAQWADQECARIAALSRQDPGAEVGPWTTRRKQRDAVKLLRERPDQLREWLQ